MLHIRRTRPAYRGSDLVERLVTLVPLPAALGPSPGRAFFGRLAFDKTVICQAVLCLVHHPHSLLLHMSTAPIDMANAPNSLVQAAASKAQRRKRFEDVFPLLKQELLEYLDQEQMPQEAKEWYDRVRQAGQLAFPGLISCCSCKLMYVASRISSTTPREVGKLASL